MAGDAAGGADMARDQPVIWRPDGFAADQWIAVGLEGDPPSSGAVLLPLARWRELRGGNAPGAWQIGVALAAGEEVAELAPHLEIISLIALDFPKFTDGRSYSAARILRERYRFSGELRATGEVLLDQIPFMLRCGFDSFAISHGPTRRALAEGRLPEVPIYLQPAGASGEQPLGHRPWLRRRA